MLPAWQLRLFAWHMLGTCLPGARQSNAKQHKASDKQWSSKCQAIDKCLLMDASSIWQAKQVPNRYQVGTAQLPCIIKQMEIA